MADDRSAEQAEIRFYADVDHIRVLDGYCAGTRKDRTKVMQMILGEWARAKLHEATMIMRVHGGNATSSRADGKPTGK